MTTSPTPSRNDDARRVRFWFRALQFIVVGFIASVALGRAALEVALFQGQGVTTEATVIAMEPMTPKRSDTVLHYRVRYRFAVDRRNYTGEGALSPQNAIGLETMNTILVRYLPASPYYSIPVDNYYTEFESRNLQLVAAFVVAIGFLWWRWRPQRQPTPTAA